MGERSVFSHLLYWKNKTSEDNRWRPIPGASSTVYVGSMPIWLRRMDLEATAVDTAPLILGAGTLRYVSQAMDFGFTATANVFKNKPTLQAMHRTAMVSVPLVLALQAFGVDYRYYIPRWASEREHRRDEDEAREHVRIGMMAGLGSTIGRTLFRLGPRGSLMDIMLGGFLTDSLLREYFRAHSM